MVKQLLNEPSLLSIVLSFLDGDALVILRSVVRLFYTATNDDRLWRFHLKNCSLALSTVASARSKCREVLVQLLTGRPRESLKQFTFCVDVRRKSDGNKVVLSAAEVLRPGEDRRVEVFVTNLLPAIAVKNGEVLLVDFNIEVYILDSRTNLYECPFFLCAWWRNPSHARRFVVLYFVACVQRGWGANGDCRYSGAFL